MNALNDVIAADSKNLGPGYPTMDRPPRANFIHNGHKISIRTIHLNQPWQSIHQDLLALVG